MGLAQEGKKAQATAAWQKMLETLPPDSPWLGAVQQALGQGGEASVSAEAQANGPDVQQMVAAQQMPPQDRQAMIETMVAGLDSRLKQSPATCKAGRSSFDPMPCSASQCRRATR